MNIAVLRESAPGETRVALVPANVPGLTKTGATVLVEKGAGFAAGYPDAEYEEKGAQLTERDDALKKADVLLTVRSLAAGGFGSDGTLDPLQPGAAIIGQLNPYETHPSFDALKKGGYTAFALEKIPRITRAQSMDVLSSQANLAGYRTVLLGALELPKMFPMMMTAAGTIVPARVFVVGVGVAGLQAIATAKRLGAVVSAYDIRPEVKDQVKSLGARFVELELSTDDSESSGGYAREMDEEFYKKQREKMLEVVAESDVVITTAAVPGKTAPTLITEEMVQAMHPGTVIVDLAAGRGGNCELTKAGETVESNGVKILGPVDVVTGIAHHASQLYSKNITTFLETIISDGQLAIDRDDEIVAATLITDLPESQETPGSQKTPATPDTTDTKEES